MIHASSLHELFQSSSLSMLVSRARKLLLNPIILTDLTHNVLEVSDEPGLNDEKWLEITTTRRIPLSHAISEVYQRSMLLHKPLIHRDIIDSVDVMRMAICHLEQIIGFIEIPCYYGIPDLEEQDLIVFLSDVACLIMKRDLGYLNAPSNEREFFISDLLEGRLHDENACRARSESLCLGINGYFRVMTILGQKSASPLTRQQLEQRRQELAALFPSAAVFLYGGVLKMIVPTKEDTTLDGLFFHDINEYLKEHKLEAGISCSTNQLIHIARCNVASEKAMEMGQVLKSDELIFFYDKYSVYHALEICAESTNIMQFCHSAIPKLSEYDRLHNTALLETLYAFLYTKQNIAEAAAKLFIHRNTMNNRLQKIDNLIHVDLDDTENLFHLMFSFHILEYYSSSVIHDYDYRIQQNPILKHQ